MNHLTELVRRQCPVCTASTKDAERFLDRSFNADRITGASYASRKEPEYMSYRLVRCFVCGTIYAAEAPTPEFIAAAYRDADYDSAEEAEFAATTYSTVLRPALARLKRRGKLVEIGTGTGALLERFLAEGFDEIIGIEPSLAAIDAAKPAVKPFIREGIFDAVSFAPNSLSMICCFQTLEHVPNPRELVEAAFNLLEPNGMLALITHDVTAPINRVLGRRSPVFDIEHLQLFCPQNLRYLLSHVGFRSIETTTITNAYPLRYWLRLAPVPFKQQILRLIAFFKLADLKISANVGNILTIVWKEAA
jgi:SAM-dependent methyltransferase